MQFPRSKGSLYFGIIILKEIFCVVILKEALKNKKAHDKDNDATRITNSCNGLIL